MQHVKITSKPAAEYDLTLETGAKFAVLAVKELQSETCYCGAKKESGQTFCKREYFALPQKKRRALYNRIGEGYEEAYRDAREYLYNKENPRQR